MNSLHRSRTSEIVVSDRPFLLSQETKTVDVEVCVGKSPLTCACLHRMPLLKRVTPP
jgi:hypothetical protein